MDSHNSQRPVFPPAPSTPLRPSVAWHRIHNDTDPRICFQPCRLLLQFAHRVTTFSHRQASARSSCSCPCHIQYQQVWHRAIKRITSRPPLVGCNWMDSFSSCGNSVPVSARQGSSVPEGAVFSHCRISKSSWQSSVCIVWRPGHSYRATDCRPTFPVHSVWPVQSAGILCLTT